MDLSIIIVNYNVRDFLRQSLESLQKSVQHLQSEIIVVDNASDDGSIEMLRSEFETVKIITNQINIGFGKANNQAMQIAKGKYFLLINPDTLVQEDTISILHNYLENNKQVGFVGCKILNADGTLQLPCRRSIPTPWVAFSKIVGLSRLFPKSKLFAKYNLTYLDENEITEVDALSGSFMMLPQEIFETVGGFDEQYFMYGEDLDLCYRAKKNGWKVIYNPSTQIIHYKGESTKRSSIDELNHFYTAMKIFYRKHLHSSLIFNLIIESSISSRYLFASLKNILRNYLAPLIDFIFTLLSFFIAEYLRKEKILSFPEYAYPWVYIIPSLIILLSLYLSKVYTLFKLSISRTILGVSLGLLLIATVTAFVKDFAFSRAILIYFYLFTLLFLSSWRFILWYFGFPSKTKPKTLFSRRGIIVGVSEVSVKVLSKLRLQIYEGYDIIGFIDTTHLRIGEIINGIPILGSVESIVKIVNDYKITDIIFSSSDLKNETILSIVARTKRNYLAYSVVPSSIEMMISKSGINYFGDIPFIAIENNSNKLIYKSVKRLFDLFIGILLIIVTPFVYLFSKKNNKKIIMNSALSLLKGEISAVGRNINSKNENANSIGKIGLTSITQLLNTENFSQKEKEELDLYYSSNQSLFLDLEVFFNALFQGKIFNSMSEIWQK